VKVRNHLTWVNASKTVKLVELREKLRANGATALTPTPEWVALRKEVVLLKGKLK
jgi:hypothetical protein